MCLYNLSEYPIDTCSLVFFKSSFENRRLYICVFSLLTVTVIINTVKFKSATFLYVFCLSHLILVSIIFFFLLSFRLNEYLISIPFYSFVIYILCVLFVALGSLQYTSLIYYCLSWVNIVPLNVQGWAKLGLQLFVWKNTCRLWLLQQFC